MHRTARGRLGTFCATAGAVAGVAVWLAAPSRVTADRSTRSAQPEGLQENPPGVHALVNARVIVSPGKRIEKGMIVVRDGVIEAVGDDVTPPADARVWDLAGKTVYPGLIDAYGELTEPAPAPPAAGEGSAGIGGGGVPGGGELLRPAGPIVAGGAPYWNPRVAPQVRAADAYRADPETNKKLRSQGIVARLVAPSRQIVKGTSAAVSTNDGDPARLVLRPDVAMHVRLSPPPARGEDRAYPNSPMGAYALVRQAILDARWYAKARAAWELDRSLARPEQNDALEALGLAAAGKLPLYVDAPDELYALRADRLAKEFDLPAIVRGSGQEYRRLSAVAAGKRAVVVPLNFARPPSVAAPEQAMAVTLDELMDWDLQPENPARLDRAGVKLALTSHGLRDRAGFLPAVRKAVKRGLEKDSALRALTTTPAELLGLAKTHGTIEKGRSASFVVTDGDLLVDKTLVLETWVDGKRHEVTPSLSPDPRGTWLVAWGEDGDAVGRNVAKPRELKVTGTPTKLAGRFATAGAAVTRPAGPTSRPATRPADVELANVTYAPGQISFTFKGERLGLKGGVSQASAAVIGDAWTGRLVRPDGTPIPLTAKRAAAAKPDDNKGDEDDAAAPARDADKAEADGEVASAPRPAGRTAGVRKDDPTTRPASFDVTYPLGAFGRTARPPQPGAVLFENVTVWTGGLDGKLERASVMVADGKITTVYKSGTKVEPPTGTDVVDCSGKHLTAGIIDCHSHIATDGGINESGRAVTCNVRVGDFVDPDDISIYRQLAGGVTAVNILHGSANPIGGQNQVVKLRWGAGPEQMKLADAPPGVKFALGENVKQSGSERSTRYPQTRLGVEQVIRDRFRAAREYRAAHDRAKAGGAAAGIPPRVDLELEAMAEIVANERRIHCHSYRQDEILAFLRVCEEFGVRVNTLQHILEGYKVADAIAKHGAAASSFSDWWAYKFEVYDAIPYNGQLLRDAGVLVSFNSDDAELARRLNLEAAKAVKYGKVPEEEALKFVTLNPAKQLGIDKRVGSIEVGKDADLVVWSGPPLSTLSRCEQTWVDGRRYFDRTDDQEMRKRDADRRAKLIQKALAAAPATRATGGGGGGEKPELRERDRWAREDLFCGCRVEGGK